MLVILKSKKLKEMDLELLNLYQRCGSISSVYSAVAKGKYFGGKFLFILQPHASSILFLIQVIWILALFHHGWRNFI